MKNEINLSCSFCGKHITVSGEDAFIRAAMDQWTQIHKKCKDTQKEWDEYRADSQQRHSETIDLLAREVIAAEQIVTVLQDVVTVLMGKE